MNKKLKQQILEYLTDTKDDYSVQSILNCHDWLGTGSDSRFADKEAKEAQERLDAELAQKETSPIAKAQMTEIYGRSIEESRKNRKKLVLPVNEATACDECGATLNEATGKIMTNPHNGGNGVTWKKAWCRKCHQELLEKFARSH